MKKAFNLYFVYFTEYFVFSYQVDMSKETPVRLRKV